ncbi:hypothetical protein Ahy_B10g103286 [Arachis hypogaea]|uniref:TORTIFOLIA1/SINE1-2 N-terminal domain-containing protein n=1 Tax=Arachis hypogaea TaxID=3818 RepID=A0A444X3I6_ARAHY|nr:hypothetical protein Ahy_B10g103286 [Arachis hypogaea]
MEKNLSPVMQQELANLDKDPDSRKSAMKALKSYVKDLDCKAIPVFLAKVSQTKETGSLSGEFTISLYEVLARVHQVKIVPMIDSIMVSIVQTLASSAGSFPLHQACSKVVLAIARYGIEPTAPEDKKRQIIHSICKPLCDSLSSSQDSLTSGAALCLKALVDSDNWRFASRAERAGKEYKILGSQRKINRLETRACMSTLEEAVAAIHCPVDRRQNGHTLPRALSLPIPMPVSSAISILLASPYYILLAHPPRAYKLATEEGKREKLLYGAIDKVVIPANSADITSSIDHIIGAAPSSHLTHPPLSLAFLLMLTTTAPTRRCPYSRMSSNVEVVNIERKKEKKKERETRNGGHGNRGSRRRSQRGRCNCHRHRHRHCWQRREESAGGGGRSSHHPRKSPPPLRPSPCSRVPVAAAAFAMKPALPSSSSWTAAMHVVTATSMSITIKQSHGEKEDL